MDKLILFSVVLGLFIVGGFTAMLLANLRMDSAKLKHRSS